MRKKITIISLIIILFLTQFLTCSNAQNVATANHEIVITTEEDYISAVENFLIIGDTDGLYETITVWVPTSATDVNVFINNDPPGEVSISGNEYTYNVTELNLRINTSAQVILKYKLDKLTNEYTKQIIRVTTKITILFDENTIYNGYDIAPGHYFTLSLDKPTETALNTFMIATIILLVIILIIVVIYFSRKTKPSKRREIEAGGSEEFLSTKKALLMELLKDIEKQHRAKEISDDTYHKLKDQYKQEAVITMKQLEDLKSKVK